MAVAASLIPNFKYRILSGKAEDEVVTIKDNTPFPDGHALARKITAESENGEVVYILPRMLDSTPVGVANAAMPSYQYDALNEVPQAVTEALRPLLDDETVANIEAVRNGGPVYLDEPLTASLAPVTTELQIEAALHPITDPMDPRLDHLRPSRSKVRRYLKRTMVNGMTDVDFLLTFASDAYRSGNEGRPQSFVLKGDTQAGKTILIEVIAVLWSDMMAQQQRDAGEKVTYTKPMPIFTLSGSSGITNYELFGQTTSYTNPKTGRESLVWLPGIVELASKAGGLLYLDEMNAMGERVMSALFPLADSRHQFTNYNKPVWNNGQFMPEVTTGHLDLWIVASLNEGYRGMGEVTEAMSSRFEHIVWEYSDEVEAKLIKSPGILLLGEALRMARSQSKVKTPVGTSALQRIQRNVQAFGPELAMKMVEDMFQKVDRDVVKDIIKDRSILLMLNEEAKQALLDADDDD